MEKLGYNVWWPALPYLEEPRLQQSLTYLHDNAHATSPDTIVIGHSAACPLILSWLERQNSRIKQAILVSGFYHDLDDKDGYSSKMLQESYDWEAIKAAAQEILLINSDNDPYGCTDTQARPVAQALGAPLIVMTGQGHMGSGAYNQPYRQFPLLKKLISQ